MPNPDSSAPTLLALGSLQPRGTHVSDEALAHGQWTEPTALQLHEEVLALEVMEFCLVPKDDMALPTEVPGQVCSFHFWKIVVDDIS